MHRFCDVAIEPFEVDSAPFLKPLVSNSLSILSCDDCGACCMSIGHPQFYRFGGIDGNSDPHCNRVPGNLKRELVEYIVSLEEVDLGQPCIWLDQKTKRCKHYDCRPQMCRDHEIDNAHCRRQ